MEISEIIKSAIHSHNSIESPTLEDLIAAYNWGQEQVNNIL
jgi:hypothetical protein